MGGGYALDVGLAEARLADDVIDYRHWATDLEALERSMHPFSESSAPGIAA
jgi:hypothetical protein